MDRVAWLEEALRPFADHIADLPPEVPDDHSIFRMPIAWFRKADEVLNKKGE